MNGTATNTLLIRNIPCTIKCAFKAYCSERGQTMTEVLIAFMQELGHEDRIHRDQTGDATQTTRVP